MKTFLIQLFSGSYNTRLAIIAGVVLGSYFFLTAGTIITINERKNAHRTARDLLVTVTQQETAYLMITNSITLEQAHARGFVDASFSRFVYTDAPDTSLALR